MAEGEGTSGRVLIVGDGVSDEDSRWLVEGTSVDMAVSENEERPFVAIASASQDVIVQGWETVRLVLESGAAAIELAAIIHRIRERKGRRVQVEVSKPPALYDVPVDLGDDNHPRNELLSPGQTRYTYRDELRRALRGIDEDRPENGPQPSRAALRHGDTRHWDDFEQRWKLPSLSVASDRTDLRARAERGDVSAARELVDELGDDPDAANERERWLRCVVADEPYDNARLALARHLLNRHEADESAVHEAVEILRSVAQGPIAGPEARLELARALCQLGEAAEAVSLLDSLLSDWVPVNSALRSLSDMEFQRAHDFALLERARLESRLGSAKVAETMYRACLDVGYENVRASAALELAGRLRAERRARAAEQLIQEQIARSAVDAQSIGEELEAQGDTGGAILAYHAAAQRRGAAALRLGILSERTGDVPGAITAYEFALASRNMLVAADAKLRLAQAREEENVSREQTKTRSPRRSSTNPDAPFRPDASG